MVRMGVTDFYSHPHSIVQFFSTKYAFRVKRQNRSAPWLSDGMRDYNIDFKIHKMKMIKLLIILEPSMILKVWIELRR